MPTNHLTLGARRIGPGGPPFVVAEVAQAHEGSVGLAHAHIDAAADAGADAVKFQTHIATAESTRDEPFRVAISSQDATRYEYWRRMEFTREQWSELAEHARERDIAFFSSPFSIEAVELLEAVGVRLWKVGSGEVTNLPLLERLARTEKPVILSSGMSDYAELDRAVELLRPSCDIAVLQCTSAYPVASSEIGLNVIGELRARYDCPVGLSDHSGTIYPSLAAVALGSDVIEIHLTLSRGMFGPDVSASITPGELRQLVEGAHLISNALASPVDKSTIAPELGTMREMFGRSVAPRRRLAAGTVLTSDDLTLKKPGTGISGERLPTLVGRTLLRSVEPDELLRGEDLA